MSTILDLAKQQAAERAQAVAPSATIAAEAAAGFLTDGQADLAERVGNLGLDGFYANVVPEVIAERNTGGFAADFARASNTRQSTPDPKMDAVPARASRTGRR
jgi:hypothetical protein